MVHEIPQWEVCAAQDMKHIAINNAVMGWDGHKCRARVISAQSNSTVKLRSNLIPPVTSYHLSLMLR